MMVDYLQVAPREGPSRGMRMSEQPAILFINH